MNAELKRRVVHALGKYVLNVPDKLLFAAGLVLLDEPVCRQFRCRYFPKNISGRYHRAILPRQLQ
jgi:hypothetical protein